jgi:hypothetical protein
MVCGKTDTLNPMPSTTIPSESTGVMVGLVVKMEDWKYGGLCHFKKQVEGIVDLSEWLIAEYEALCGN